MTFLACKVVEKSLTKKCYGITEGRTDGMTDRCKPVFPHFFKAGQGCKIFFLLTRPVGLVGGKNTRPYDLFTRPDIWVKLLPLC